MALVKVALDPEWVARLDALAKAERRSRASMAGLLLERALGSAPVPMLPAIVEAASGPGGPASPVAAVVPAKRRVFTREAPGSIRCTCGAQRARHTVVDDEERCP